MTFILKNDKKCHDGLKKKNAMLLDTMNIFKKNKRLT